MAIVGNYNHVHLVSPDPEKAAEWYVKCLDGEIFGKGEVRGVPGIRMKLGDASLYIRGVRPSEKIVEVDGGHPYGLNHICFTVEGIEEMLGKVEKNGGVVAEPLFTAPSGNLAAFVQGPDDVLIEMVQFRLG